MISATKSTNSPNVSKLLVKKFGNLPRRKEDDPFFAIYRYYCDKDYDIALTDKQKERREIYEWMWDQYSKGFSRGATVKKAMVHFWEERGWEIAPRTGYDYLRDAIDIFGDIEDIDLNREKRIMIEMGKEMMQKALEAGEHKTAQAYYSTLVKIFAFDKSNSTLEIEEILKKLVPHTIEITSDPATLRAEGDALIEDILHEEIPEDGEGEA